MLEARPSMKINIYSIEWFLTFTISGGLIAYLTTTLITRTLPLEMILRVAIIIQVVLIALMSNMTVLHTNRQSAALGLVERKLVRIWRFLKVAAVTFVIFSFIPFCAALIEGTAVDLAVRSYYFLYGIGVVAALACIFNLQIHGGPVFRLISLICIFFGALQVYYQELLLPAQLREFYGLQYEFFTGGRLRAVSFFNSAPRFAEFISFFILYLVSYLLIANRNALLASAALVLLTWLLYNTFSRSGFILTLLGFFLVITIYAFNFRLLRNWHHYAIFVIVTILLVQALIYLSQSQGFLSSEVFDTASLDARVAHWDSIFQAMPDYGVTDIFFGQGLAALFSRSEVEYFVVDNLFIAVFLYSGLAGVVSAAFFFGFLLRSALLKFKITQSPAILALLSLSLAMLFEGLFVDNHNAFFFVCLVMIGLIGRSSGKFALT